MYRIEEHYCHLVPCEDPLWTVHQELPPPLPHLRLAEVRVGHQDLHVLLRQAGVPPPDPVLAITSHHHL